MQFADTFIAVSSVGVSRMDYLALPALANETCDLAEPPTTSVNEWDAIKEILFDNEAKAFVDYAKGAGIPAPDEDNIGFEVEGNSGEVIATVEIAWPDKHVGFMTADQMEDKEKLQDMGWKILNIFDAADIDIAGLFGGEDR